MNSGGLILAVDPGGTTGWVVMRDFDLLAKGEEKNQQAFLDRVWEMLRTEHMEAVVCERFVLRKGGRAMTNEPAALEIIGALRWMCGYTGSVTFHMQSVSDAMAFGTKERIAAYPSLREPGFADHAKMALSHALLYQTTKKGGVRRV